MLKYDVRRINKEFFKSNLIQGNMLLKRINKVLPNEPEVRRR